MFHKIGKVLLKIFHDFLFASIIQYDNHQQPLSGIAKFTKPLAVNRPFRFGFQLLLVDSAKNEIWKMFSSNSSNKQM